MRDIKCTKAILNERRELVVSFVCKPGDFTETEALLLQNCKLNWDTLDVEFTWLTESRETENNVRCRKLQTLWAIMERYCESSGTTIDEEQERIYQKYLVWSRKQLSDEQLDFEIESYKAWILQFS